MWVMDFGMPGARGACVLFKPSSSCVTLVASETNQCVWGIYPNFFSVPLGCHLTSSRHRRPSPARVPGHEVPPSVDNSPFVRIVRILHLFSPPSPLFLGTAVKVALCCLQLLSKWAQWRRQSLLGDTKECMGQSRLLVAEWPSPDSLKTGLFSAGAPGHCEAFHDFWPLLVTTAASPRKCL